MKTYVCSDIHAHWDVFKKFIDTLDKDDKVYFLGDAEDKGPDPLKCLKHIIEDDRFEMILGNHDYMFYTVANAIEKPEQTLYREDYENWLLGNYGYPTFNAFEKLPEKERIDILNFLQEAPIFIKDVEVNGRKFDLCHSYMWNVNSENKTESMETISETAVESFVWNRPEPPYNYPWSTKNIVIGGHTITYTMNSKVPFEVFFNADRIEDASYINIDCGMAYNRSGYSRFAVLCLDDLSIRYFDM